MTLTTVRVRVSNRRTSPERAAGAAWGGRVCAAVERGEVGDGTGDGYARNEGSEDGDSAHIAEDLKLG